MMTEQTATTAPAAAAPVPFSFTVPNTDDGAGKELSVSIDLAAIPPEVRMELLQAKVKEFALNRANVTNVRFNKAFAPYAAWDAYNTAQAADALQTAVKRPDGDPPKAEDRPAKPDLVAKAADALGDLLKGQFKRPEGEGRKREPKDPLTAAVTGVVVRQLFDARKAADAKYKWTDAVTEVGGDGIKYLNGQIDAKVTAAPADAQAALRKQLEDRRDTQFINPARTMLGLSTGKKIDGLPSLLG